MRSLPRPAESDQRAECELYRNRLRECGQMTEASSQGLLGLPHVQSMDVHDVTADFDGRRGAPRLLRPAGAPCV